MADHNDRPEYATVSGLFQAYQRKVLGDDADIEVVVAARRAFFAAAHSILAASVIDLKGRDPMDAGAVVDYWFAECKAYTEFARDGLDGERYMYVRPPKPEPKVPAVTDPPEGNA